MITFRPRDVGCWRYSIKDNEGKFLREDLMFDNITFKDADALQSFIENFFNYAKEIKSEFEIRNNSVIYDGLLVGYIIE